MEAHVLRPNASIEDTDDYVGCQGGRIPEAMIEFEAQKVAGMGGVELQQLIGNGCHKASYFAYSIKLSGGELRGKTWSNEGGKKVFQISPNLLSVVK